MKANAGSVSFRFVGGINTLCQTRAKQAKLQATVTGPSNTNPY